MSGTRQTQFTVSGQSTDWKDPDAARVYIERIMEPVFKRVRNTVNQLSRDWIHVTASQFIDAKYGLVLVDATAGAVTLTIPAPVDMFHPIVVVKTDASGNSVTVQVRGGATINGAATDVITARWDIAAYEGDETQYVKVSTGNIALGGDVTGSASANTVSKLQTVLLTIGTPSTGDVLMYDGTQITPTPQKLRVLDTTYSPVGLWNMQLGAGVGPKDYSGNGNDLTTETGTQRYSAIHPSMGGILFDGATIIRVATPQAVLQLTGAFTMIMLGMWSDLPAGGTSRTIVSHMAAGETSDTNYLYAWSVDVNNQCAYFSEHGAGVNDSANNNTFSPRSQVALLGMTRSSGGVLNFWYNGTTVGASFGTVTLPTDGSNGLFRMGGDNGGAPGNFFTGVISSFGLYNTELNATQMLERYNYTCGRVYGFR